MSRSTCAASIANQHIVVNMFSERERAVIGKDLAGIDPGFVVANPNGGGVGVLPVDYIQANTSDAVGCGAGIGTGFIECTGEVAYRKSFRKTGGESDGV